MKVLNREFRGELQIAIDIFTNQYHKHFLHQLVSGQLDVDRMDYLTRDSFFTGVAEGVIGYDRILKMLTVHNGEVSLGAAPAYRLWGSATEGLPSAGVAGGIFSSPLRSLQWALSVRRAACR